METGPQALGPASKEQMDQNKLNEAESLTKMSDEEMETSDQKSLQLKSEERLPSVDEVLMKNVRNNLTLREQDDNIASNHEAEEGSMDLDVKQILEDERGMGANQESYFSINMDQNMSEDHLTDLLSKQKNNIVDYDYQQPYPTVDKGLYNLDKARSLWAALEQHTTQLSQELTEQLRLIMEPSLASRLEGDYRTGKRINLKKVIPYIASQFRRDKIWLRRTKPSKRQYQVVLAIDDSRSMSENHCGYLALAALVTICRSMSTLEVGQMAVASFGQKGNVRVLHDFDSPFSMESGIEIISQFTFRQDNTIADEPMADLLHYITWMLDSCAHKIFGRHQIQQLVLIIADGRFHEKEKLRHCIREALSRGQMVAFIVLDNAPESIMDVQSVSFSGGVPAFSKYIDTFPFPYYILLKNIEELPRTLADLLRQWFEMVQRSSIQ
ncbi:hypothetical protein KP509_31G042700 [Ceratopteris richardii]|uniref:VWFA domain-containing protein n=1 Tax=Ceratopteris richardii TaxID=49495 RepID=A0A8T2QXF7_CERRI|nr:hypothetical protein KP509_31G042700 [Ceratopteris richardii]